MVNATAASTASIASLVGVPACRHRRSTLPLSPSSPSITKGSSDSVTRVRELQTMEAAVQ
jgi:hypothetical protein